MIFESIVIEMAREKKMKTKEKKRKERQKNNERLYKKNPYNMLDLMKKKKVDYKKIKI